MTERLAPADAAFFYTEEPAAPLHVGGVVILQPEGRFDFSRITRLIDQRLTALPRFRQIVREVPGRLARPVWIDDASFDLDYHVRRSALPHPGSDQQLAELVGRLISRPLDRSRPLWELYVVEGLEDGRVALVHKTHEALLGGIGIADIVAAVLDDSPQDLEPRGEVWIPAPAPNPVDLVVDAVGDLVASPGDLVDTVRLWTADITATVGTVLDTGRAMLDVARRTLRRTGGFPMHSGGHGPRLFATADLDLGVIKKVRAASGGTVNDVVLAIVTGAIRSWMLSRGEPVTSSSSLVALAPTAVWDDDAPERPADLVDGPAEEADAADVIGPRVATTLIDLPIAEPNALMRLHQLTFQMAARSESSRPVGADVLLSLGRFAPGALHGMGARVAGQLSRRSYDLLVTNVPGPQHELYAAQDQVIAMYPIVPLVKGHALAIGCTSYLGRVHVGLVADREALGDLTDFAQLISDALTELAHARPARRRPGARPVLDRKEVTG